MGKVKAGATMSLDGFIAGPNETVDNGLGDGGERLHEWVFAGEETEHKGAPARPSGVNGQLFDEFMSTGAVVAGMGTFEPAGGWGGDHHDGVPVFVLTHDVPDDPPPGSVRYVTDVRECAAQARAAAGDGDVMVHGAGAAQALLRMARCYEQLGNAEAQQVYERIVREFKDQSEAVEVARTRLVGRAPSARPASTYDMTRA